MRYEEEYDNKEREWDNFISDMAQGVYEGCKEVLERQITRWSR